MPFRNNFATCPTKLRSSSIGAEKLTGMLGPVPYRRPSALSYRSVVWTLALLVSSLGLYRPCLAQQTQIPPCCIIPSATPSTADNVVRRTFDAAAGESIYIETELGDINVVSWRHKKVEIVAKLHGSEGEVNSFGLSLAKSGPTIQVRGARRPQKFNLSWGWWSFKVEYIVKVPQRFNLHLHTKNGDISVANVDGGVQLETVSGDVHVKEVAGELAITTAGGEIEATKVTGDLKLQTGGGDVMVINAVGSVDVATTGGDVEIKSVKGKIVAASDRGDIAVSVSGRNKGLQLNAESGDIDIFLTGAVNGNIDAQTNKGEVQLSNTKGFRGNIKRKSVNGALNGGGSLIKAKTVSGTITIKRK